MRLRPLPFALAAMVALLAFKLHEVLGGPGSLSSPAAASAPPQAAPVSQAPAPPAAARPVAPSDLPETAAERAVLEALRARRTEIEAREAALAQRQLMVEAAERRLAARLEELTALQSRLEAEARARDERAEQGWRQMVRTYEAMRPRDAAAILEELDMSVAVPVLERMREARAAPVLAAMRPERARGLTAELARARAPKD